MNASTEILQQLWHNYAVAIGMKSPLSERVRDEIVKVDLNSVLSGRAEFAMPLVGMLLGLAWIFKALTAEGGRPPYVAIALMATIWIVVPWGLRASQRLSFGPKTLGTAAIRLGWLPAAGIASLAFGTNPGKWSAFLSLGWLAFAVAVYLVGISRLLSREQFTPRALLEDFGLVLMIQAGFTFVLYRLGAGLPWISNNTVGAISVVLHSLCLVLPWLSARILPPPAEAAVYGQRHTTMHVGPRSNKDLYALLARSVTQPTTNEPGLVQRDLPAGYNWNEWTLEVSDFEDSCEALYEWAGHREAGIIVQPPRPPIAVGETFAFAIPFGPLSISAVYRIVGITNEDDCYGFTFSTLSHHAWSAEESIIITNIGGQPKITATAIWKPTILAARISRPVTSFFMGRFMNRILQGLSEAEEAEVGSYLSDVAGKIDGRALETTDPRDTKAWV